MSDTPQSGWYPDPTGRHENRWWDGVDWSDQVADGQTVSADPVHGGPATPAAKAVDPGATQPIQPVAAPLSPTAAVPVGGPPGAPPAGNYVGPAGPGQSPDNRKAVGIVVGLLIAVAVVVGLVLATGGGDDSASNRASSGERDRSADFSDEPSASDLFDDMASDATDSSDDPFGTDDTTPTDTTPTDTTPTGGEAYPQEVIDNFVTACVGGGASSQLCECTIDVLQRDVSYERFVEIDQQLGQNPNDIPQELTDAVTECR